MHFSSTAVTSGGVIRRLMMTGNSPAMMTMAMMMLMMITYCDKVTGSDIRRTAHHYRSEVRPLPYGILV